MPISRWIWTALLLISCAPMKAADAPPALWGFSPESSRRERSWEEKFKAIPSAEVLKANMKRLSARPHHLGSPYDKENAEWILSQYEKWGYDARIETFDALFATPKERVVELIEPRKYVARLTEPPISVDPTSGQTDEQLPPYNMGSIDGDVTAPLVYVHYGVPDDYDRLERLGISVKGAIVLARYGGSWRGIKPKVAAEHGAVGCLIYSDPHEDGYFQGDVFPQGGLRPSDGVQRGSVLDMPLYPGDPQTPGVGATPDAKKLDMKDAKTITKIPVLPLSYGDALPLLQALAGPMAPAEWRGSLPIPYHLGPGPAKVRLRVKSDWKRVPIYDVIAKMTGTEAPDEWVIRGNHHDAWVNGAEDPISGQVALLEEARAFGELRRQGWRPKRTLVYCSWDGEEEGLFGSTEWAETHEEELERKAVAYVNSDGNGRGFLGVGGSHSLEKFINDVARDVQDPEKKISVWKRLQASKIVAGSPDARGRADLKIGALGSGSDYSPFIDHLGVASLNLGFGGEDESGVYHSAYDDFYWYAHFGDADFAYGRALAQTAGLAVMRLAQADLLPFKFSNLAETVKTYVDELQNLLKSKRDEIQERNRQIAEGDLDAVSDPKKTYVPPKTEEVPPFLNFAPLQNASDALSRSAGRYDKAAGTASAKPDLDPKSLRDLNETLIQSERKLLSPDGLPDRPWYRHLLYAPGFYTGYGVKTIPGVREAIEQKQWKRAEEEIVRAAQALEAEARLLDGAATQLEKR
jgi:N-acetylated-alpha-linked acidic dipeptidase